MEADKKPLEWPGTDDRAVVAEMLSNSDSKHWEECVNFVITLIRYRAKNIPLDLWEDISQEIMIRIHLGLPHFQHQSSFTTWLFSVYNNYIKDTYRRIKRTEQHISLDYNEGFEHEGGTFPVYLSETVEDKIIIKEMSGEAEVALKEFLTGHTHAKRNKRILEMVFNEGFTCEAAAKEVGCSGPVASYVVRSAKEYVRKKLGIQKPQKASRSLKKSQKTQQ